MPVLTEADLVSKGLVAELASKRPRTVVTSPRVNFKTVRRREHFLALRTRVHLPWLCHHHHDDDDATIITITLLLLIIVLFIIIYCWTLIIPNITCLNTGCGWGNPRRPNGRKRGKSAEPFDSNH